jgi:hypothetical protein
MDTKFSNQTVNQIPLVFWTVLPVDWLVGLFCFDNYLIEADSSILHQDVNSVIHFPAITEKSFLPRSAPPQLYPGAPNPFPLIE